jgi:hypothetical protein
MGLRLIGYACPKCGQDEALNVQTRQWAQMTCEDAGDGAEFEEYDSNDGPWDYDDNSTTLCPECEWRGRLGNCVVPIVKTPQADDEDEDDDGS